MGVGFKLIEVENVPFLALWINCDLCHVEFGQLAIKLFKCSPFVLANENCVKNYTGSGLNRADIMRVLGIDPGLRNLGWGGH